jgi:very-short-patch-repair endonuclease
MAGVAPGTGDLEARCESDFERDVLRRLVQRGYSVTPQVGSAGYRIDLVVEGTKGRRLAVECDGDKYHGPERWNEDIRRQRILERVGWRFWRCWASSFTIDPDGCMADLFGILSKAGIEPVGGPAQSGGYTLHIIIDPPRAAGAPGQLTGALKGPQERPDPETGNRHGPIGHLIPSPGTIRVGDRVVIRYLDDHKQATFTLSTARNDLTNGFLSVSSPLGQKLVGSSEEDELEFEAGGRLRRVLVLKTERVPTAGVS